MRDISPCGTNSYNADSNRQGIQPHAYKLQSAKKESNLRFPLIRRTHFHCTTGRLRRFLAGRLTPRIPINFVPNSCTSTTKAPAGATLSRVLPP